MVENIPIALAFQVEEGVVREVAKRSAVGGGGITNLELVVVRQGVAHGHIEIAWETVFAIGKHGVHLKHAVVNRNHIPNAAVGTDKTAMKCVLSIILCQLIRNTIQGKSALGNAVGTTTHHGTKIAFTFVFHILVDMIVAKNDIFIAIVAVRHPEGNHTPTIIGDLHRQKTIV